MPSLLVCVYLDLRKTCGEFSAACDRRKPQVYLAETLTRSNRNIPSIIALVYLFHISILYLVQLFRFSTIILMWQRPLMTMEEEKIVRGAMIMKSIPLVGQQESPPISLGVNVDWYSH